jgi:insulysin
MEIVFPFPDQRSFYKSKPASYLAHFLGHEGPGSILSYLKRKGWVNSIRAGAQNGSSGFELFKVTVDLTEDGLSGSGFRKHITLVVADPTTLVR